MANTYTQIYIHAIFAVEGRQSLIAPEHKIEIYKYMTTVVQNQKNKIMAINGMPDHVHLLVGLNPDIALSHLVRDAKAAASNLINDRKDTERFRIRNLRCRELQSILRTRSAIMQSVRFVMNMRLC